MVRHLHRLFAYDDWANREVLASLKKTGTPPRRSLRLMGHIIGAERLGWAACSRRRTPQRFGLWQDYLNGLESWANTVEDILTHVVMHAEQAAQHADGGSLPRVVRPEQPEDFAGGERRGLYFPDPHRAGDCQGVGTAAAGARHPRTRPHGVLKRPPIA